jgi:calmodulin
MAANDVGETYDTTGLLSDEQLRDLRAVFDLFDTNGNGSISAKELGTVMRTIGQDPTEAELQDIINDRDADGSGTLDFLEFVNLMGAPLKGDNVAEDIDTTFRAWCDRDGNIKISDLRKAMTDLGETFDQAELEEMVREADSQFRSDLGDGSIQIEEFRAMLKAQ